LSGPARHDELSTILRQLRRDADLSGMEAAERAGFSQPKISRFETGRQVPTPDQVRTLARVYRAPAEARRRLLELAGDLRAETRPARAILSHGAHHMQQRLGRLDQASARIRMFVPTLVPGPLQTPAYVRAIGSRDMNGEQLEQFVAARIARQATLDTDREFVMVVTEGALRWHVGGPEVMAEQLQHVADQLDRPNLHLGVIPWTRPVHAPALHSFDIYDARAVVVGTETATAIITDPRDVADYEHRFDGYASAAVFGNEARAVLARIADEYRALDPERKPA
jgi:transcriptional regulator with XRE-family HTH domain